MAVDGASVGDGKGNHCTTVILQTQPLQDVRVENGSQEGDRQTAQPGQQTPSQRLELLVICSLIRTQVNPGSWEGPPRAASGQILVQPVHCTGDITSQDEETGRKDVFWGNLLITCRALF